MLTCASRSVDLLNRPHASARLADALAAAPYGLPTGIGRHVAFDEQSTVDDLREAVRAQLSVLQANRAPAGAVRDIAAGAVPQLAVYGKRHGRPS